MEKQIKYPSRSPKKQNDAGHLRMAVRLRALLEGLGRQK